MVFTITEKAPILPIYSTRSTRSLCKSKMHLIGAMVTFDHWQIVNVMHWLLFSIILSHYIVHCFQFEFLWKWSVGAREWPVPYKHQCFDRIGFHEYANHFRYENMCHSSKCHCKLSTWWWSWDCGRRRTWWRWRSGRWTGCSLSSAAAAGSELPQSLKWPDH